MQVTLGGPDGIDKTATTDSNGSFLFAGLPSGTYKVKAEAAGLQPWVSEDVRLGPGEELALPAITVIGLPTTTTTVDVHATLNEIAIEQVREEEKQRILGFLPNFYSSYIWDAAPMTPGLKFKLALRSISDPFAFVTAAGAAGAEQVHKTFPGYRQGAEGYGKRYGAAYADGAIGRMVSSAILPTVFHQDPRYFYRGSGTVRERIFYALRSTVICRGDNGQLEPNYSHVLGGFVAAGISNLYRAPSDRSAAMTFRNGLIITGGSAATNLLREFLSRKLTPNVPAHSIGKP